MTNSKLIELMKQNDHRAWAEFFESYYPRLLAHIANKVPDRAEGPEDVAMSTIKSIFKNISEDGASQIVAMTAYLFSVGRNKANDLHRKNLAKKRDVRRVVQDDDLTVHLTDNQLTTGERTEIKDSILSVMQSLNDRDLEILDLAWQGNSQIEIARKIGYSLRTVQVRLKSIRELFDQTHYGFD